MVVLSKIDKAIANKTPIEMDIAAYPFKSPSPKKTLGTGADRAEEESFKYFLDFCKTIEELHPDGGVKLHIYSDGGLFGSVVKETTADTRRAYFDSLKAIVEKLGGSEATGAGFAAG